MSAAARRKGRGRGSIFYGCSRYPDCDFTTPYEPIAEPCPKCGAPFTVMKRTKQGTFRSCLNQGCDYEIPVQEEVPSAPPSLAAEPAVEVPAKT